MVLWMNSHQIGLVIRENPIVSGVHGPQLMTVSFACQPCGQTNLFYASATQRTITLRLRDAVQTMETNVAREGVHTLCSSSIFRAVLRCNVPCVGWRRGGGLPKTAEQLFFTVGIYARNTVTFRAQGNLQIFFALK